MKAFHWAFVVLLFAMPVRAQDCGSIVVDQAGVFKPTEFAAVVDASNNLIDNGADVRVRTVGPTSNLDIDEKNLERVCQSWQSPNGGRKSTLIVLMVSPQSHKAGIYIGESWKPALAAHWNRIKTDYMNPHFKTGDFAGGFIATEQQLAARITASRDEAIHPAVTTTTTVNQAEDLSGLWRVFGWLIVLGAIGVAIWMAVSFLKQRRKSDQELREAQRRAIDTKARAAELLKTKASDYPKLDEASQEFARLNTSIRNDPYADDLAVEEYNVIASQYQNVVDMLSGQSEKPYVPPPGMGADFVRQKATKTTKKHRPASSDTAASQTAAPSTAGGFPVPIIIEEPTIIEEPRRREPDPEPQPERSSRRSSDDDGGSGGGSSSWADTSSSSDSGSSDSGGSSDFGSSDSGGGGSSDY
jgi:uncharacterized membrane protein YgcG